MKNPKILFDINSFNLDNILDVVKKNKKKDKELKKLQKEIIKKIGGYTQCQRQVV